MSVCVFVLPLSVCRLALVYKKYTQSPWPIQGIALLLPLAYRAPAICDGVRRYSASLSPPSRVRGGSCVILVGSGEVCRVRACVCVCWIVVLKWHGCVPCCAEYSGTFRRKVP